MEAINNRANGCGLQITAANFPGRAKSHLFALQQTCLHQPFDRAMTDAAYSGSLAQTNSLQIGLGSLLAGNGMVAPGCCHANLIPSLPFAGRIAASVNTEAIWSSP